MTYLEKKEIADKYIDKVIGLGWDSLSDINSLHDVDDEEGIIGYCDDRMNDIMG